MIEIKNQCGEIIASFDVQKLCEAELSGRDLSYAHMESAKLHRARLISTRLFDAYLQRADFRKADLSSAEMAFVYAQSAKFTGANLSKVSLWEADLSYSNLTGANLRGAWLAHVVFHRCCFDKANMEGAKMQGCFFTDCEGLHTVDGLERILHEGPSYLDRLTLQRSIHKLPDVFLEGCGYTLLEIKALRALYTDSPIRFSSCFVSHGEPDLSFAERLLADLRHDNVTCWHYKQDMRGGTDWKDQVKGAIKQYNKLILICSQSAVYRRNVVDEILECIKVERETGEQKLFPIRLDDHILGAGMLDEAREKVKSGEWAENWVYYVTKKHVPDFSAWEKDNAKYQQEFKKLLEALQKAGPAKGAV